LKTPAPFDKNSPEIIKYIQWLLAIDRSGGELLKNKTKRIKSLGSDTTETAKKEECFLNAFSGCAGKAFLYELGSVKN